MLALSVPDEGYSKSSQCTINLISTFLLRFSMLLSCHIHMLHILQPYYLSTRMVQHFNI